MRWVAVWATVLEQDCVAFLPKRIRKNYRTCYESCDDGINWKLALGYVEINISKQKGGSEMIEYSFVFKRKKQRDMLFNGNCFGLVMSVYD